MIITIEGKQGEGKSRLARSICGSKKAVYVNENVIKNKEWMLEIDPDTEYLVVDAIVNLEKMKSILKVNSFSIRRPYSRVCTIVKMPPILILIVQSN